jgi:hypothetical protein
VQQLRYLREGVFSGGSGGVEEAQRLGGGLTEDLAAFQNFAADMHSGNVH